MEPSFQDMTTEELLKYIEGQSEWSQKIDHGPALEFSTRLLQLVREFRELQRLVKQQ